MAKLLAHGSMARNCLARGVSRLAAAVEPTLGPKGLNAMVDRPVGTPLVTRDGVSIASEIEFNDRFENMGAQVVREVSMQTNDVAGDGTTTAIVLANALIRRGVELTDGGVKPVDLCKGIDLAVARIIDAIDASSNDCDAHPEYLAAVARVSSTDTELGALVAEAFRRVGRDGVISAEFGVTIETTMDVVEGMSFERGYISHHMVTDRENMVAVLRNPLILMTDQKILKPEVLDTAIALAEGENRPLLIVAEEIAPEVVIKLLDGGGAGKYLIVHPPEYGHWRSAMMDDLAILTGGEVLARDLGKKIENVTLAQLGGAETVRSHASGTSVLRGEGDPDAIAWRSAGRNSPISNWSTRRASIGSPPLRRYMPQSSPRPGSTSSTCTTPTGMAASSRSSTVSGSTRSAGTCSSTTSWRPRSVWASTPSTATTPTP